MKFIRFSLPDSSLVRSGVVEESLIREFTGDMFALPHFTGQTYSLSEVSLQAPLLPRHIIGIGRNFVPEGVAKPPIPDLPVLFFKPQTAVIGPHEPVILPPDTKAAVKFESELAVVIGKTARNVSIAEASNVIFGFTVANDICTSSYYHPDGHWTIGKSFDTFCPLGPMIETDFDYRSARIQSKLNGVLKQNSSIERMIMPIDHMISCISRFMTLSPGDVILTGTPPGAETVNHGDIVDCFIEGIGQLSNPIQAAIN